MASPKDNSSAGKERSSGPIIHCTCSGKCVISECIRKRTTAHIALGNYEEARKLADSILSMGEADENLREQLSVIYESLADKDLQELANNDEASDEGKNPDLVSRVRRVTTNDENVDVAENTQGKPIKRRRTEQLNLLSSLNETLSCVICSKLLFEPVTTPCGHTFCRICLFRAVDCADACPMCRTVLHLEDPANLPVTNILRDTIVQCFPDEYQLRKREVEVETPSGSAAMNRLPLFPLSAVVFPMQKYPMHIFEARYRLMLRRIMQGSRKFGLISLRRTPDGGSELCDVGCVLEVVKTDRYPDGRSFIETVARERFKVHGHIEVDGYLVGRTEVYEDEGDYGGPEVKKIEQRVRVIVNQLMEMGSKMPAIQHILQRARDVPSEAQGPGALGMWLAGLLVSSDMERQLMLEMRDSEKRLKKMVVILERFRDSMQAMSAATTGKGRDCCIM